MKDDYLPLAISFISICLISSYLYRLLLAAVWLIIFNQILRRNQRLFFSALLIFLIICSIPLKGSHVYSGRVESIRDNYLIVRDGLNQILVYYQGEACLDDEIIVDDDLTAITSYDNFDVSSFSLWAKGNNIIGQLNLNEYRIQTPSASLRGKIYRHNQRIGNLWINELLFGSGLDLDSSYAYLFIQCGLHISFLARFIKQVAGYFVYQDKASMITIVIMSCLAVILRFPFVYLRTIVFLVCSYLIEDKRNALALSIIALCFLKPYYVCSTAFLIPVGMRLISLFSSRRLKSAGRLYLAVIQLRFYGYVNVISLLAFSVFSRVSCYLYVAALLFSLSPVELKFLSLIKDYLALLDRIPQLLLRGKPDIVLVFILLGCVINYLSSEHRKHLILATVLLTISFNRRLLCPFYTITQLDVGQGDSALITVPFSAKGLLIDVAGNTYKDIGNDIILPYLYGQGIRSCDIIITHDDYDHSGSLDKVIEGIRTYNVYRSKQQTISFADLCIQDPLWDREYEDSNDNSLISYFTIGDFSFLYLGDISSAVESDLVDRYGDMKVDIVKLAHHGSRSASSEKLISHYQFPIALISAGRNNSYDHPHKEVVERLESFHVKTYSTKQHGAIRMIVMKGLMIIVQPSGQLGIYRP